MANQSPHPNSNSPRSKQNTSAFQWPIPSSPLQSTKPNNASQPSNFNDITVKEILDRYGDDPELLKYILTAKSEEDKKKAARDTLKAEEARIQLRQMDIDIAREQSKASLRYDRPPAFISHVYPQAYVTSQPQPYSAQLYPQQQQLPQYVHNSHSHPQPLQQQQPPQQHQQPQSAHPSIPPAHPQHSHSKQQSKQHQQQQQQQPPAPQSHQTSHHYSYYGLAPVQQQVLARFNYPVPYGTTGHHGQPPPSPSVPYPHSAHPLCPPTTATNTNKKKNSEDRSNNNGQHLQHRNNTLNPQQSPTSPAANGMTDDNNVSNAHTTLRKRNRASFSSSSNEHVEPHPLQPQQDKLSHNKVMEALKAKIQRGNSGPNTGGNNNGASSSSNVPNGTSGTTTFTTSSVRSTTQNHHQESNSSNNSSNKRRKPTLPKPSVLVKQQPLEPKAKSTTSTTPSPRSAKPILPPIDTSLGRTDCASTKFPNHPLSQHQSSGSSSSSHSTAINSFNDTTSSHTITRNVKLEEQSASMDNDKQADTRNDTAHHNIYDTHNTLKLNTTVSSPSDHILLNTRRARSLSPSPSTTSAQK